eukprot:COSAG01_NODE_644_length_14557_cov_8.020057_6_plen_193_part_00
MWILAAGVALSTAVASLSYRIPGIGAPESNGGAAWSRRSGASCARRGRRARGERPRGRVRLRGQARRFAARRCWCVGGVWYPNVGSPLDRGQTAVTAPWRPRCASHPRRSGTLGCRSRAGRATIGSSIPWTGLCHRAAWGMWTAPAASLIRTQRSRSALSPRHHSLSSLAAAATPYDSPPYCRPQGGAAAVL